MLDELVEEPPGTLVLERDGGEILAAKDGDEDCGTLEPLQESYGVFRILETVGEGDDKVKRHGQEYEERKRGEHVGVDLCKTPVAGLQAFA